MAVALLVLICHGVATGQVVYGLRTFTQISLFNFETCTFTDLVNSNKSFGDIAIGINNELYGVGQGPDGIYEVNTSTGAATLKFPITQPMPGFPLTSLTVTPDGTIYAAGFTGLYVVPVGALSATFLGAWPPNTVPDGDCSMLNGVLYVSITRSLPMPSTRGLLEVNIANPAASTIVMNWPYSNVVGMVTVNGPGCSVLYANGFLSAQRVLFSIDPATQTTVPVCNPPFVFGGFGVPPGYVGPPSMCCAVRAGTVMAGTVNYCLPENASVPHNGNEVLDSDDVLRFIIYTNPANILGSILSTSVDPSFVFNPAIMNTGITYYVAAVAGNNLNGNIDLNDPCLDISNQALVVWRPQPTVAFSVANPNICAGNCKTITATFTGTAPFTLSYTSSASGAVTQTFLGNTGTFQLCPPANTPSGNLVLQSTGLSDGWCSCQ